MLDADTRELVRCKRPIWVLLTLAFGPDHRKRFVYRPGRDRFELHAAFEYARENS